MTACDVTACDVTVTATCLRAVVGGKPPLAPCKILSLLRSLVVLVKIHGEYKTVTMVMQFWPPSVFWSITGCKIVVSVDIM